MRRHLLEWRCCQHSSGRSSLSDFAWKQELAAPAAPSISMFSDFQATSQALYHTTHKTPPSWRTPTASSLHATSSQSTCLYLRRLPKLTDMVTVLRTVSSSCSSARRNLDTPSMERYSLRDPKAILMNRSCLSPAMSAPSLSRI